MRTTASVSVVCGVLAVLGMGSAAWAAPSIQLINNFGSRFTQTTAFASTETFANPYGDPAAVSPFVSAPIITPITNGVSLAFAPKPVFTAQAASIVGPTTQTFDGNLSFLITFDSPVHVTANLSEGGGYQDGNGVTSVKSIVFISIPGGTEPDLHSTVQINNVAPGDLQPWTLHQQLSGFTGAYTTFMVSVDNILEAQIAGSQTFSTATIDKKVFTLSFTTDGGGGGVPEPTSLSVLAVGSLALMARRRRA